MRLRSGLAVATVGPALLTACGQGQTITAGEVTVLVSERPDGGMDALAGGSLEVLGGCLGAGGAVFVWPHGTEVVGEDPLTVDVPGYGRYSLGDEVQVAGGYVLEHDLGPVETGPREVGGVEVPAECGDHDVFLAH